MAALGAFVQQHDQLHLGMLREEERRLGVAQEAAGGVVEGTLAALAAGHGIGPPRRIEERAVAPQPVDQRPRRGVCEIAAVVGAELGREAAGPLLPVGDERAGGGRGMVTSSERPDASGILPLGPE